MPVRPLVVVTDYVADLGAEKEVLGSIADLTMLQTYNEDEVIQKGLNADVLLVFHGIKLTERTIGKLERCQAIIRCGVGYDNVDLRAAGQRGIVVCNVPDYGTEEVADHAMLLLLAAARRLLASDQAMRQGNWDPNIAIGAPRLRGKTLGIIGCGRIGTAMALRAKAFGLRVVFYDPYKPAGLDKALGIERVFQLEELLPQSQFLSIHCPMTSETRHILNPKTIALLPRGCYVINTARGPCIDLKALGDALDSGQVGFAGLDVFEKEPLEDERIRRHPHVVLSPHGAFYSVEGYLEMRTKGAQEAKRLLQGEYVRNPVNLHCLVGQPRCKVAPAFSPDA